MRIAKGIEMCREECCALAHAFANNRETVKALCGLIDPELLRLSADILLRSTGLFRRANLAIDGAYETMAAAELERLKNGPPALRCAHSVKVHEAALRCIVSKCSLPAC